ncbi:MAG: helix-turn-helix domain-containing protein [Phenylobacterium sp.]|nr:helix-turn-helix domain-containing protein [Phenylobacterium sp.]
MGYRYPRLEYLRKWPVAVPSGRLIYDDGEAPEAFYRVESGCIRLQKHRHDGRRQILAFCLPGDVFGLDFCEFRPMAAEAAAASKLTRFSIHQDFRDGGDCSALLAESSRITGALSETLIVFNLSSASDRVVWFLNWLAERQGAWQGSARVVHLPMNRLDIADYLGLAPETLSRTLTQLVAAHRIRKRGRTIWLGAPCQRSQTPVGQLPESYLSALRG